MIASKPLTVNALTLKTELPNKEDRNKGEAKGRKRQRVDVEPEKPLKQCLMSILGTLDTCAHDRDTAEPGMSHSAQNEQVKKGLFIIQPQRQTLWKHRIL